MCRSAHKLTTHKRDNWKDSAMNEFNSIPRARPRLTAQNGPRLDQRGFLAYRQRYTLLFEVEDTGTGFAPEELTLLFNAFAQTAGGRAAGQRWKARVWAWGFITVSRNYWAAKSTSNLRWSKARYSNIRSPRPSPIRRKSSQSNLPSAL